MYIADSKQQRQVIIAEDKPQAGSVIPIGTSDLSPESG
jgi:hypothetical protein